jgi:hypothetical protein
MAILGTLQDANRSYLLWCYSIRPEGTEMAKTKTRPVGRTPVKRKACSEWLKQHLDGYPSRAREIQEVGAKFGWGWATIRNAKKILNIRSLRQGDEWWWFDPETFTPSVPKSPWAPKNIESKSSEEVKAMWQVPERAYAAEPRMLPQGADSVFVRQHDSVSPKGSTNGIVESDRVFEQTRSVPAATAAHQSPPQSPLQSRAPEMAKLIAPVKPRRFLIWEKEVADKREAVISAAGFTDLYIMRADIRTRQEQLRKKGLLREEAALNDLALRINEALDKKKKDEKIDGSQ